MALSRRNGKRFEANIWPGFVDAMTALLLVLVFVLSIFMIVQFMLSEKITSQDSELNQLTGEVASLAQALGLEQQRSFGLEQDIEELDITAAQQATLIASLSAQNETQASKIASFEEQVAGLLSQREGLRGQVASLTGDLEDSQNQVEGLFARIEDIEAGLAREISQKEAAQLALATARAEIDEGVETARLAAARREALEALVADLQLQSDAQSEALSAAEAAKLIDDAAADALRARLQNADAELTAMTLALETQRKEAEDTLTLLAAARAAEKVSADQLASVLATQTQTTANLEASQAEEEDLRKQLVAALAAQAAAQTGIAEAMGEAEQRAALLSLARSELADEKEISLESQRKVEVLNQQVAALRTQLGSLQSILDETDARREASDVQVQNLGAELNSALALVASEQRSRAKLEEAERLRLEAEAKELKNYRSEFFGQLRALLGNQDGIRIEGDRFVFSSEVLFQPGRAVLSPEGKSEVAKVATILSRVAGDIPDGLDWVIRVDGHTDNLPLSGVGRFKDNWELSQARALSVVRYMSADLGIAPSRLAANGFGEFQPINLANTPEARAQNRRIELKLTEK
ncbi:peptidoglycan -binding protein [uncultured Litoreibacter sp.]|uniref:peptidoglycan -binding protein n=1 Tax=uncultured Litoreibacter sp. TaxID=1392394 RepID=UPI002628C978|nr:peptidoglycan -binding protein [uncultured Litoreibacter sp.]